MGELDSGRQQLYFFPPHNRQYKMIVSQKVTNFVIKVLNRWFDLQKYCMVLVLPITSKLMLNRAEFPALTTMKLLILESVNLGLTKKNKTLI